MWKGERCQYLHLLAHANGRVAPLGFDHMGLSCRRSTTSSRQSWEDGGLECMAVGEADRVGKPSQMDRVAASRHRRRHSKHVANLGVGRHMRGGDYRAMVCTTKRRPRWHTGIQGARGAARWRIFPSSFWSRRRKAKGIRGVGCGDHGICGGQALLEGSL